MGLMQEFPETAGPRRDNGFQGDPAGEAVLVESMVRKAAGLLIDQAPLETFVAQNTLQVFEGTPFHDAMRAASGLYGANGYLTEPEFQDLHHRGEITETDLAEARTRLGRPANRDQLLPGITTQALERALLFRDEPRIAPASRAWWLRNQHPAGPRALEIWKQVLDLPWQTRSANISWTNTPGDLIRLVAGFPLVASTRSFLVEYCSRYLDRGMAGHHEPATQRFWPFFLERVAQGGIVAPFGPAIRADALERLGKRQSSGEAILELLGFPSSDPASMEEAIQVTVLRHPGWAAMFHRLERNPEDRPKLDTPVRLIDFVAAQLMVEFHLALDAALQLGMGRAKDCRSPAALVEALLDKVKPQESSPALERDPWNLCLALLDLNVRPGELAMLSGDQKAALVTATTSFGFWQRLALWQEALENNLRGQVLRALSEKPPVPPPDTRPVLEVMACLDDREESFRRALENIHPLIRTWGAPGFYQLPVAYKDLSSPFPRILCPLGVAPAYTVREKPTSVKSATSLQRTASFSRVARNAELSLRNKTLGALVGTLAAVAAFPLMVLGLFFPRWREFFQRLGSTGTNAISLDLPESVDDAGVLAFPLADQASRVGGLLKTIGLTGQFAPLVVVLGHGSHSANNPHKSAYDCGACRGHEGHNNARLFATLANRPEVRAALTKMGIMIPEDTWFVGGRHDTCAGSVQLLDTHLVPTSHQDQLHRAVAWLRQASEEDAVERCRRFRSAPARPDGRSAFRHVRERSVDPDQPRPELGHMTNAMVIIGRRWRTRGLFLDRRSFLVSYDPEQDADGAILANILRAITPIVVGINLQYYFSRTDPIRYGSGSKLPHNPVGLVGVMEGSCGDLRTGLPRQMVELHTPLRLLYVVEAPSERVRAALQSNPDLRQKLANQWCSMAVLDPHSTRQWLIEPDLTATGIHHRAGESTPRIPDAKSWFAGQAINLPIAWIDPAMAGSQALPA